MKDPVIDMSPQKPPKDMEVDDVDDPGQEEEEKYEVLLTEEVPEDDDEIPAHVRLLDDSPGPEHPSASASPVKKI